MTVTHQPKRSLDHVARGFAKQTKPTHLLASISTRAMLPFGTTPIKGGRSPAPHVGLDHSSICLSPLEKMKTFSVVIDSLLKNQPGKINTIPKQMDVSLPFGPKLTRG